MTGKLKDIVFGRNGEQIISITVREDFREDFDKLKDVDVDIEIKKHREKRSNDANSYCWELCAKIADKLADEDVKQTKEEVYRAAIREVGVFFDLPDLDPKRANTLRIAWESQGTGWVTEQVDYSRDGEKVMIRFYYGSSRYNTKQMSRLIDNLIEDCRALGIPTETPDKINNLKSLWTNAPQKGN